MKTISTIIFIFVFTTTQFAQSQLTKPKEFLKNLSFQEIMWSLSLAYESKDTPPFSTKDEITNLNNYIDNINPDTLKPNLASEYELLKKHQVIITKVFNESLQLIGDEMGLFVHMDREPPCRFFEFKKDTVIAFPYIASIQVCNILRLNEKERRETFIDQYLVNALEDCFRVTGNTFKNIGVGVTYGSKDFSSDDIVFNQKAEIVFVISSLELQNQLSNFEITLEEYKAKLTVFHYSRDRDSFVKIQ